MNAVASPCVGSPSEGEARAVCRSVAFALASAFFLLAFALSALAAELPALTGRVVDNAGMIDAAAAAELTAKLEAFERKTSIQVVVATVDSLDGEAIESYANRLFRAWRLDRRNELAKWSAST